MKLLRWLSVVFVFSFSALFAAGQTTSATLTGAVSDQSGAAIPGASVVVENLQTNVHMQSVTNAAGFYRVSGLLPGLYRLTADKAGFKSVVRDGIELHAQDEVAINFRLQVGSVTETVTVNSGEPLLQTQSGTVSTVIESQQIQNTPLNGRNVMNLAALTPGVVPQGATSGNPLGNQAAIGNYTNPAGWDNYQIGGAVTGENLVFVDGAPLNLPTQNWIAYIPTQDSIREFRVETNNISSQYGEYYGGVLNFTTKSGTNSLHGSAYEYFRNTVLDANSYINNQTGVARPPLQQNQYGVTLGGPLIKNKMFLFGSWEGYANRSGLPYETEVPTVAETQGDFTADPPIINTFTGQQISCNGVPNKVCPDPTALYMASGYKYWAQPNIPNVPHGGYNFSTNASSGNNSNQYMFRGDYQLSPRQQLFARYTLWKTTTLGTNYYHNNLPQPEVLSNTQQAVAGDTVTINNSTVLDVRASYLRFLFTSQPPFMGKINLSDFGPAYGALQSQVTYDTVPVPFLVGYGSAFPILITNVIQFYNFDKYYLSANLTKTIGRNALVFGGQLMRNDAFLSGGGLGPAGIFMFLPGLPTTDIFANFMMGNFLSNGPLSDITTARNTSSINIAQGYYVNDTYQMNSRVTLTGGIRWDLPGAVLEKHNVNTVFLPNLASPVGSITNPQTGQSEALHGNLALVASPEYSSRNDDVLHYHLFAPNVGFSVRVLPQTVVRGGFGMSFISYTDPTIPSPYNSPITQRTTPALSANGGPLGQLSNPFPQLNGVLPQPAGRDPNFAAAIQGISVSGNSPGIEQSTYPYVEQWNLNIQHQLTSNSVVQIGYQGSKGTHLRAGINPNENQLPDSYAAQAATQYQQLIASGDTPTQADASTFLNSQVANPMAGKLSSASAYNGSTIAEGQLLMPYPQFATSVTTPNRGLGTSIYHAMQATYQVHLRSGGEFFAAYTWSKLIGTVDSHTGFLEGNTVGAIQDNNNLKAERSLESFDVPQRLVLNYSLALPVGKGQKWAANAGTGLDKVIGGWRLSSITTFQIGYPLALSALANDLANSFGAGTIRPNRVPGCNPKLSGSATSRLKKWFNTACFVQPPTPFSFGNEPRVDSQLRGEGIDDWDLSLGKDTKVGDRLVVHFEAEFLNAFNRVQFGPPDLNISDSTYGQVSNTLNNPRQIQFAARFDF